MFEITDEEIEAEVKKRIDKNKLTLTYPKIYEKYPIFSAPKYTLEDEIRIFKVLPHLYELVEAHYKNNEEIFENELNVILKIFKKSANDIQIKDCKNLDELKINTNILINSITNLKKEV